MKREQRRNGNRVDDKAKKIIYLSGSVLGIGIIAFVLTFTIYSGKVKKNENSALNAEKVTELVPNTIDSEQTEEASMQTDKSVEQMQNNVVENTAINTENMKKENYVVTNQTKQTASKQTESDKKEETSKKEEKAQTKQADPEFIKPVEGEVLKAFAKDSLQYSETLKEWVLHPGIDIKADKTTVVKVAADGTVESIKNDPRYGLTVTIAHTNGYKSVYANLLTAEFVTEGEKVTAGQSIGTVGNTATFEIADEPHLHFEILKDNENVDPEQFIK